MLSKDLSTTRRGNESKIASKASSKNSAEEMIRDALAAGAAAVGKGVGSTSVSPVSLGGLGQPPAAPQGVTPTEAVFISALDRLVAASGGKVTINNRRRSSERQKELWAEALQKYGDPEIADNWVARPGHSKHEQGIAADLGYADAATKKWVHDNAASFGIHFPLSNEDWHAEVLGSRG
jgi:hypothetical protein